ncbi:hypothetical protein [Streptomyces sp. YGL11-2]|uniref:hypothetical protein n=1 Tax=Streptomyces sp. YGL11-2 TaxID=3414028 RepID=UPI003CE9A1B0
MRTRARAALSALTLTATLAGSGMAFAGTAHADSGFSCRITASAANIRSQDNAHSTIVGVGYSGDTCHETNMANPGDGYMWYYVTMDGSGVSGWVRGDLLWVDGGPGTCIPESC